MKFCNNCGKQLQDDEVCTCQSQNTEAAASEAQAAAKPIITKEQATEISLGLLKYAQDFVKNPLGAVDEVVENGTIVTAGGMAVVNAALAVIVAVVRQLMNLIRGYGFSFNTLLTTSVQQIIWWVLLPLGMAGSIWVVTKYILKNDIDFKKALNVFSVTAMPLAVSYVLSVLRIILNHSFFLTIFNFVSVIITTVMYFLTVKALMKLWNNKDEKQLLISIPALCLLLYFVRFLFNTIVY